MRVKRPCHLLTFTAFCFQQADPAQAAQYIPVPWSLTYYGPDGPWQAVRVTVGGTSPKFVVTREDHKELDLIPGGVWDTKVLSSKTCIPYNNAKCGRGGTWDPRVSASVGATGRWTDEASRVNSSEQSIVIQATTVSSISYWNSSIVIVSDISITNPDGSRRGPELGTLALGGPEVSQKFTTDDMFSTLPILGFSFAGAAYNAGDIKSFSYGLQIGSTNHEYPGSLIFGGYDKGRLIGPYTSFNNNPLLLDVSLGVATGGSPWEFKEKRGLLISNTSQSTMLPVSPDPRQVYLHLPSKTCEEIAKYLPVTFDTTLKYWLWDTQRPEYTKIVRSPAYLGFTFPPAPGASKNVTIKVPFSLLNLTLDVPITKKPASYFPCQGYNPSSGNVHVLGRSFLQGAFLGRNWNRQVSWLAQAPGPGISKTGLGNVMLDIEDKDLDLPSVFTDESLFTQSWANYWTLLPEPEASRSASPSTDSAVTHSAGKKKTGLSTGAKVGVGLGVLVIAFLVIGILVYFVRYRQQLGPSPQSDSNKAMTEKDEKLQSEDEAKQDIPEMQGDVSCPIYELPDTTQAVHTIRCPRRSLHIEF